MRFIFSGVSRKNLRSTNQDSLYIETAEINGCSMLLAAVCDGVGSLRDGEFAGVYAVKMLKSWFDTELPKRYSDNATMPSPTKLLAEELYTINSEIYRSSQEQGLQTGSTISVLFLMGGRYFVAHLGDSRIYYYNGSEYKLLTRDHVAEMETGSQAGGPRKTGLSQCLGAFESVDPFFLEGDFGAGDIFMMCSDGFYRRYPMRQLPEKFRGIKNRRALSEMIGQQVEAVAAMGEKDNISLAVIKIDKPGGLFKSKG